MVSAEYSENGNIKNIAKSTFLTCFIICYLLNCDILSLRLQHPLLQILNVIHYHLLSK